MSTDFRGLYPYSKPMDDYRRGPLNVEKQKAHLIGTARTIGILKDRVDWLEEEITTLGGSGFAGRLFWSLPPHIISTDDLIAEADKYRDKNSPLTNNDSSIWIADEYENGLTGEQWNGPDRPPEIRLAVYRARTAEGPDSSYGTDPMLHGMNLPYDEQLVLCKEFVDSFNAGNPGFNMEPITHKDVVSMVLSDRLNDVPTASRVLSKGFMRSMFGWWYLYGNAATRRCGSLTLSSDWLIMNESAGYAYPNDGFGLSIGISK